MDTTTNSERECLMKVEMTMYKPRTLAWSSFLPHCPQKEQASHHFDFELLASDIEQISVAPGALQGCCVTAAPALGYWPMEIFWMQTLLPHLERHTFAFFIQQIMSIFSEEKE